MPEFQCPWCVQMAQSPRAMRDHLRKVHQEKVRGKSAVFVKCEINMSAVNP